MMGLLSACGLPMSENVQVEELLRAPRLPGDYGALQNALNEWLGESAQLKYPMQGELLSPFLLQDLDGDGQQDAAVLYTTAQSSNVCIAFLQKDAAGVWQVSQSIEGLADTVDNVRLAQLQDGAATQLVVGYLAAQGDSYLAVYSYENGTVNAILEQSYEQYLVEDITGGGNEDLILMSTLEDGGVQIELLTVDRDGMFQQVAVMGLSADKFSGCAAVAAGLGADGKRYLVLDGWTGLSGNNLATVLLYFDEDSQQMLPAEQISTSELYNASLRNVSNTERALSVIRAATGFSVEVISGEEEAAFGYAGAMQELDLTDGLFVDLGGASTEGVRFAGGVMESANSCPVGSLKLYRDFVRKILPNKEAIHHMEKAITLATLGVVERPVRQGLPLVCVGGTARAALKLAKRVCRLPETSNSITIGQLDRVCQELCASQKQAADLILKIEPERIHTMIPGMLILRHMVQGFGAGRVIVSQYGVREGYLCQKILKAS